MELIETVELASSASSITFSSIPQTYTDLKILLSLRSDRSYVADSVSILLNSSSSNFSKNTLQGNGSSVSSNSAANNAFNFSSSADDATANTFGNFSIDVSSYTSSTAKSISSDSVTENNATGVELVLVAMLWNNTSAIDNISFSPAGGTVFLTGSSISLYGIRAGSDGTTTVS